MFYQMLLYELYIFVKPGGNRRLHGEGKAAGAVVRGGNLSDRQSGPGRGCCQAIAWLRGYDVHHLDAGLACWQLEALDPGNARCNGFEPL